MIDAADIMDTFEDQQRQYESKFAAGETVWLQCLGIYATITEINAKQGMFSYRMDFWKYVEFSEALLTSKADHEARQAEYAAQVAANEAARRIKHLALVVSEPYQCSFDTHLEYRRAYIRWASWFGGSVDMPPDVRETYWQFMLTREG